MLWCPDFRTILGTGSTQLEQGREVPRCRDKGLGSAAGGKGTILRACALSGLEAIGFQLPLFVGRVQLLHICLGSAGDYQLLRSDFCSLKTRQCHPLVPPKFLTGDLGECCPNSLLLSLKAKRSWLRLQLGSSWFRMLEILRLNFSLKHGSNWRHTQTN